MRVASRANRDRSIMLTGTFKRFVHCSANVLVAATVSAASAQSVVDSALTVRQVVTGLSQPTAMAFIGSGDILVLQKNDGRVRRVIDGVLQAGQVLDVAVDNDSERGLLGIALHPNFPATAFVYLYYTQSSTSGDTTGSPLANRVYRYTWNGTALTSPALILDLPVTDGPNHNGGTIAFGPDGKLYVVIGDLNRNGQLQNFSTGDPDDTGVILRVNADGSIPSDNPFFALGGNFAKYYAYGVRNSFGLAFDPLTGKLWDTENGPNSYDEINLVNPGFNSGWEQIMGPDSRDPQGVGDLFQIGGSHHYADPKFSWLQTVGPTAIAFLNSAKLGVDYQNDVFVGDINNGNLYRFRVNAARNGFDFTNAGFADLVADNAAELQEVIFGTGFAGNFAGITDIKVGPDGLLYVLSFGQGKIFAVTRVQLTADFDGDIPTDPAVYQSSGGNWFAVGSSVGLFTPALNFGGTGYLPVPGDYDGDGKTDAAVYQTNTGNWFVVGSSSGPFTPALHFGGAGYISVPGDYDGDGKIDPAVYQQSTGNWFSVGSTIGLRSVLGFGGSGYIPVPGDYDGDGETDAAVYQTSTGNWFVVGSTSGFFTPALSFGGAGYISVPGDYDGDGKIDPAVYQESTGNWFSVGSTIGLRSVLGFGGSGYIPVPGDYDGDGKTDAAVYQQSTGYWFVVGSSQGFFTSALNFGGSGFVPVLPQVTILRAMGLL